MPPIVAVVGSKNSGKTSVIQFLISKLSLEGFKVGSIKHIYDPDFSIDTVGKDTWRYAQAGAKVIVSVASSEMAIIKKANTFQRDLDKIVSTLSGEELDIIFLEGFRTQIAKRNDIFKIITAKTVEELTEAMRDIAQPILAVSGLIAKQKSALNKLEAPLIDLDSEGHKLLQLIKNNVLL
jgi:molybdopterin-guanine dinucleotide biosynthesis protein B